MPQLRFRWIFLNSLLKFNLRKICDKVTDFYFICSQVDIDTRNRCGAKRGDCDIYNLCDASSGYHLAPHNPGRSWSPRPALHLPGCKCTLITIMYYVYIMINALTDEICIWLQVSQFGPLACSVVTTTRKFFTVLASVIIFGNVLLPRQWLGAILVFTGMFHLYCIISLVSNVPRGSFNGLFFILQDCSLICSTAKWEAQRKYKY